MANQLYNDYGYLGLSLDDICAIIAAHPNLSKEEGCFSAEKYGNLLWEIASHLKWVCVW